jgi:hypothetical protein
MFNAPWSTLKPEDWLKTPAVIELESLEQGACNFFILLLCTLIRENLKASPHARTEHGLRHVIFIEEAHNLIAPQTEQASQESVNPKISATAYIVKMLAEVRALRESIVIADQLPSAIASEVMKNTGLKIVHRMTAEEDRGMVGSTMSATGAQLEQLGTYDPGDALIFYEGLQLPFRGKIAQWGGGKFDIEPKESGDLALLMTENEKYRDAMKNTADSMIGKLYFTIMSGIDKFIQLTNNTAEDIRGILDQIEFGAEETDYWESLSNARDYMQTLSNYLMSANKEIFHLQSMIAKQRNRFPQFYKRFDEIAIKLANKVKRHADLSAKQTELSERIEAIEARFEK